MAGVRGWLGAFALFVGLAFASAACGTSFEYLKFRVPEDGSSVEVEKFFNEGMGLDGPATRALAAAKKGRYDDAIAILNADLAQRPDDTWGHYDRGILFEAKGDFDGALRDMKEAQRLDAIERPGAANQRLAGEIAFIEAHRTAPASSAAATTKS